MRPTEAIVRYDLSLTYFEFSLLGNSRGFIGGVVAPVTPVSVQNGKFDKVQIASVLTKIEDTARAPDGSYKRDDFEWTPDSFQTVEHGVEEPVDDRRAAIYGDHLRAEQIKSQRAANRVLQAYEGDVAGKMQNTSTFANAAAATAWTTKASADPIADVDNAMKLVRGRIGALPNVLVLTYESWLAMQRTDRVEDLLKYSGVDDPKTLGALNVLRQVLNLQFIAVAGAVQNTADGGLTASVADVWDKTIAGVYAVNPTQDIEDPNPCACKTLMWNQAGENAALPGAEGDMPSVIMEEYREEARRGSVIRARLDYDVKVMHAEAGQLITGVVA